MHLLDLFCGRGGWSRPWTEAGLNAVGIDIADHDYPGRFLNQRLPTDVSIIIDNETRLVVASPPCQNFARHHLPWINAPLPTADVELLDWSISLTHTLAVPVIVECSVFAARHSRQRPSMKAGPYALWGAIPALLPTVTKRKMATMGQDPAGRAYIDAALSRAVFEHFGRPACPLNLST